MSSAAFFSMSNWHVITISVSIYWSTAEVKDIIKPVSLRELDCIPDKLSASGQSDDRQTTYVL